MTLVDHDGRVEAAICAEDNGFATEKIRAVFLFGSTRSAAVDLLTPAGSDLTAKSDAAVVAQPLYGPLFFQGERFRRCSYYSTVSARHIVAALSTADDRPWFTQFESQRLVLGEPGARDALLHLLQAAVPHRRVIPISVDQIVFLRAGKPILVEAIEQFADRDTFVFDISVRDESGAVVETWQGAKFRAIADIRVAEVLAAAPALACAYVERIARDALDDCSVQVALIADQKLAHKERRARVLASLSLGCGVFARADGRPIVVGNDRNVSVSLAHRDCITLAVKADREIACDIELVSNQSGTNPPLSPSAWELAADVASSGRESWTTAAARVWALQEVAAKGNYPGNLPWQISHSRFDGLITFESVFGRTTTLHVPGPTGELIVAIGSPSRASASRPAKAAVSSNARPELTVDH
jgi:enediyne polyketide synthase